MSDRPRQVYNPRTRRWETEGTPAEPAARASERDPLMPFGQHEGLRVSEVNTGYLRWMVRECDLEPGFRRAVQEELADRE